MNSVVTSLNGLISSALALLLSPLQHFNPLVGLLLVSVLLGVLLLLVYGRISFQEKIKDLKRDIQATLLEAVLYRHDIALSIRAQGKLLRLAGYYFLLAFPPLVVMGVPCLILLAHLNTYYGYSPLQPGQSVLFTAKLAPAASLNGLSLSTEGNVRAVGPVRSPSDNTVTWRLDVPKESAPTSAKLTLTDGRGQTLTNPISVIHESQPIESVVARSWFISLLYPSNLARSLPASIDEIRINYPDSSYAWLGLHWNWLVLFFVVSMIAALAASRVFKVEI